MEYFYETYNDIAKLGINIKKRLFTGRSKYQKLDFYETAGFGVLFTLDDLVMLTEKDEFVYHEMIVHPAVFIHKNPERLLIIGGGDGGSVREAVKHPYLKEVHLCELDDLVIEKSKEYLKSCSCELDNPRVKIFIQDGFDFLRKRENYYDIILIDSTDPIGEGAKLFDTPFIKLVYNALKDDGIAVRQSESPFYDMKILKEVYEKTKAVFPVNRVYKAFIPTYPSGLWTFLFASKTYNPLDNFDANRFDELKLNYQYYNKEIQTSCFSLPEFIKKELYYTASILKCHR